MEIVEHATVNPTLDLFAGQSLYVVDIATPVATAPDRPWGWLIGSLIALFLSLGANAYLGMLLGAMRQRYLRDIQQGYVKA